MSEELVRELIARPPMVRELPGFDAERAPEEPAPLFVEWLRGALAADVPDAQVVTLSTVDAEGMPDARVLVLRDVDPARSGWVFWADADSPKGRQLAADPRAAMTVYWPQLGRQVRVRGTVRAVPAPAALTRSPGARAASLVGRQSEPLGSAAEYDAAFTAALAAGPALPVSGHTVYTLEAATVEFWQGDPSRRHVRLRYERSAAGWSRTLLWP
ncbi:pyridoxal 5'-phosphate synthase [Kitasatospora sp. NPDC048365]|uniref:pyridoxine/pyridoxamine 5'-phosphate oxidase n=1 Tax=Kitasatospora sp. NPDC048365 TaxID=3364050 RepID=UPI00371E0F4C